MRVLVDINHPAHVHLFKNVIWELQARGHEIAVTSREKEMATALLEEYNIEHTTLSEVGDSLFSLATEFLQKDVVLYQFAKDFQPDVYLGLNPAISHVSAVLGGTSFIFHDTESSWVREALFRPFADVIFTPSEFDKDLGSKQVRYPGYHELAYLHPNRFVPKPEKLRSNDIRPEDEYYVLRAIGWDAHHDYGKTGLSHDTLEKIVSILDEYGDVYITGERMLPERFERYKLDIPPSLVHDLLYYADGYIGDSGTMATEAAVLGTPAIRVDPFAAEQDNSNFVELEDEYRLLFSTPDERRAIQRLREQIENPSREESHKKRRERLLEEKVDVTEFIVERVESMREARG